MIFSMKKGDDLLVNFFLVASTKGKRIENLYSFYKNKSKSIDNLKDANELLTNEYNKINECILTTLESLSLELSTEITTKYGTDAAKKFRDIEFFKKKITKLVLIEEDLYYTTTMLEEYYDESKDKKGFFSSIADKFSRKEKESNAYREKVVKTFKKEKFQDIIIKREEEAIKILTEDIMNMERIYKEFSLTNDASI